MLEPEYTMEVICGGNYIYLDETLWWVFNDNGNIHGETSAEPIGLEIQAQAFAFSTNDEIINMTFYKYKVINRSSFDLMETYFGQWVDPDLGNPMDEYVGCDVGRGLGYCYNGNAIDDGAYGYGINPPAVGLDFFEGPFMDADGQDNPVSEGLNGLGFGDGIVDNERIGMAKFVYYINDWSDKGNPETGSDYYNYLKGIWKNNQDWLSTKATVQIRVNKPYESGLNSYQEVNSPENKNYPLYSFSTEGIYNDQQNLSEAQGALDIINLVPNPYYGYSDYETNQLDNRIMFINLPEICTIKIFTVNGTLIREFNKDNSEPSLDWDLKNQKGIPVASGVYIINIEVDGVGEKVLKWFGVMGPIDLDTF